MTNEITDQKKMPTSMLNRNVRRVVVKAGSALLTGSGENLNLDILSILVEQISKLRKAGIDVLLVSSGAVAAGRKVIGISDDEPNLPMRQALAAVGQGRIMHSYEQLFEGHNIPVAQALLSRNDFSRRLSYLNVRNTLLALLDWGVVPIINENDVVAVDELSEGVFGDNDTLSSMVATMVEADLLILLGEVEGLFTSDPNIDSNAKLIKEVRHIDESIFAAGGPSRSNLGRGGMATKIQAAKLAVAAGVNMVISSGLTRDIIIRLVNGERIGTLFHAVTTKMENRKRWMLTNISKESQIHIDKGAEKALIDRQSSLLSPGISKVVGVFERGEVLSICDSDAHQIACGISNYSSSDLTKIAGMKSEQFEKVLDINFGDEIVHRNNMVILTEAENGI
ncbi:MAG: glutamate 5-kinase [Dehalococcoidia bacterium]